MMNLLEMSRQNIVFRSCCHILLQCLSQFHLAKTLVNKNAKGGVLSRGNVVWGRTARHAEDWGENFLVCRFFSETETSSSLPALKPHN